MLRKSFARLHFPLELWDASATKMSASHSIAVRLTKYDLRKLANLGIFYFKADEGILQYHYFCFVDDVTTKDLISFFFRSAKRKRRTAQRKILASAVQKYCENAFLLHSNF